MDTRTEKLVDLLKIMHYAIILYGAEILDGETYGG